jgi:hypothetical protein
MLQNLEQILGKPPYAKIQNSYRPPESGLEFVENIIDDEQIRLWFFRTVEDKYHHLGVRVRDGSFNQYNPEEQLSQEGQSIWIDPKFHSKDINSKLNKVLDTLIYIHLESHVSMAYLGPNIFRDFDEEMKDASKEIGISLRAKMRARLRATISAYGVVQLKDHPEITEEAIPRSTPEERAKITQEMRAAGLAYEKELIERGVAPLSKEELEDFFVKLLEPEFGPPKT